MSEFDKYLGKMFGKPHCQCLYEIENNLPRTIHCFMPCQAQRQILERRAAIEWWNSLDESAKKELSENYAILTEEEIETLHVAEHRKNFFKNKNKN